MELGDDCLRIHDRASEQAWSFYFLSNRSSFAPSLLMFMAGILHGVGGRAGVHHDWITVSLSLSLSLVYFAILGFVVVTLALIIMMIQRKAATFRPF